MLFYLLLEISNHRANLSSAATGVQLTASTNCKIMMLRRNNVVLHNTTNSRDLLENKNGRSPRSSKQLLGTPRTVRGSPQSCSRALQVVLPLSDSFFGRVPLATAATECYNDCRWMSSSWLDGEEDAPTEDLALIKEKHQKSRPL